MRMGLPAMIGLGSNAYIPETPNQRENQWPRLEEENLELGHGVPGSDQTLRASLARDFPDARESRGCNQQLSTQALQALCPGKFPETHVPKAYWTLNRP